VDVAGNVGPTVTIKIDKIGTGADQISWPVSTNRVQVSKLRTADDNLYTAPSGRIYVRADGRTPVKLSFESYMNGTATKDYQISEQEFYVNRDTPGTAYRFRTVLPNSTDISKAAMQSLPAKQFQRYGGGTEKLLLDASNTGAQRGVMGTKNIFFQCFMIPQTESGKVLAVTPGAGAGDAEAQDEETEEGETYMHSVWEKDILNAIYLYPDGEGPAVTANQDFDSLTVINLDTIADKAITFTATDELSGLREMSVRVINQDNSLAQTIKDTDKDGVIALTADGSSVLFEGDVMFEVTAVDNVGNRNVRVYGKAEYTMQAEITHSGYNPNDATDFRRGDPALLYIETTGFADTIRMEVPRELKSGYPSDQKEFYGLRDYRTVLYINFNVPEDCPPGTYSITVHSYKNGVRLEARPVMITVLDGPTSGIVHVRLR
ncbi:MAG: hypothetical protein ILP14_05525, partial [Oscillospiraceae bacterium]|nr:hypothetical protein [Oscillospiraceae bacterium]